MNTAIIDVQNSFEQGVDYGVELCKEGIPFAFPTETVYGLGASIWNEDAIHRIFELKGRPSDNPLIVHVSSMEMAESLAYVSPIAQKLAHVFWGGPLTMVLPKRDCVLDCVTAGLPSVAIRMPSNPVALALIEQSQTPIAAPSANKSGRPSPTTAQHVYDDFHDEIPLILDGGACSAGVESTVLLLTGDMPTIVRPGIITQEMIADVLKASVAIDDGVLNLVEKNQKVVSPGMKYKHYAPNAEVVMVQGELIKMAECINQEYAKQQEQGKRCLILATEQTFRFYIGRNYVIIGDRKSPVTLCNHFYDALRQADLNQYDIVFIEAVSLEQEGLAYMNRALRAAGFHVLYAS